MKKTIALMAFILIAQSVPVLAQDASPYGENYPEKAKKKMGQIMALDPNGDGLITETEFISNAKKQFDEMNYNNDDYVDMQEVKRYRAEKQAAAQERREAIKQRRLDRLKKIEGVE